MKWALALAVRENVIPPTVEDINLDEERDTVAGMHNDLECAYDIEPNDVHVTDDEDQQGSLDDDIDDMNDTEDDYFNDSLFM